MHIKRTCFGAVIVAFAAMGMISCSQDEAHSVGDSVLEQDPDNPGNPDGPQGYQCGNNQVVCDGVCVHLEDDVDHCGACGNKCADSLGEHATDWICRKNTCVAQACRAHYHLLDGACVEDDVTHCAGTNCTALLGWGSGYCDEGGQCVAEACLEGYQLNTDDTPFCEEYVQDCDGDASVCELRTGAAEMACIEGKCAVSKCEMEHYHWNEEQTSCIPNSIHECGDPFVDCTNYAGWNPEDENNRCDLNEDGVLSCIASSCIPNYHVHSAPNAPCEPDDHENCGEHGHACEENQVCLDGGCTIECADGLKNCDGVCVDLASNVNHCGDCGVACSPEAFEGSVELACEGSVCKVKSCKDGYYLHDGKCEKNSSSDCGGKGVTCAGHLTCIDGKCGCASGMDCGSSCVDVKTDKNNCGGCGKVCKAYQTCTDGKCGCASGTDCGSNCVDVKKDKNNCGTCGNICKGDLTCIDGKCGCASGTVCGSSCVDVKTDNNNCGGCGYKCGAGKKCSNGSCVCNSGTACGSACVDTKTDNNNCGGCGRVCAGGSFCAGGSCQCSASMMYCGGKCVHIYSDVDNCGTCGNRCYTGMHCLGGSCQCDYGTFCAGSCVDVHGFDSNNCGSCGWKCGSNQTCEYGICKDKCPAGITGAGCSYCDSGYTQCGYRDGYPLCLQVELINPAYCNEYCNKTGKTGTYNGQANYYNAAMCAPGQTCYLNNYSDKTVKCK